MIIHSLADRASWTPYNIGSSHDYSLAERASWTPYNIESSHDYCWADRASWTPYNIESSHDYSLADRASWTPYNIGSSHDYSWAERASWTPYTQLFKLVTQRTAILGRILAFTHVSLLSLSPSLSLVSKTTQNWHAGIWPNLVGR